MNRHHAVGSQATVTFEKPNIFRWAIELK